MSIGTASPRVRRVPLSALAVLALFALTAIWGSTFPLLKGVVTRVPVADFLAVRFGLAAVALVLLRPRALLRLSGADRRRGLLLGAVYGVAQVLQTVGLQSTSAAVSGFVTGMYVVLTPVLGVLFLQARTSRSLWTAVGLATAGLAVLALRGFAFGGGELLTLVAALLYAVHILGLGLWSTGRNAVGMTTAQLLTVSVVCGLGALPGGLALPQRGTDWVILVYMALAAGTGALLLQTWAQAHLAAARAAILMTLEPVWAGIFAVLIGGERLGLRVLLGGGLVLAAMYLVETAPPEPDRAPGDAFLQPIPPA